MPTQPRQCVIQRKPHHLQHLQHHQLAPSLFTNTKPEEATYLLTTASALQFVSSSASLRPKASMQCNAKSKGFDVVRSFVCSFDRSFVRLFGCIQHFEQWFDSDFGALNGRFCGVHSL